MKKVMSRRSPKDIERYQKHYSDKGLLDKIGKTFKKAGRKVIYYVLLLFYVLKDENTPTQHKMIILGALGYFILPMDLIPDFIPIAGFTDDATALISCLRSVYKNTTPEVRERAIKKLNEWFEKTEPAEINGYDNEYSE